jgi:hypothetical protein
MIQNPLAAQAQSKRIGDTEYTVTPLGFRDARRVLVRVGNILGPKLADLLSSIDLAKGLKASDVFETEAMRAIGDLLGRIEDKDLQFLEDAFSNTTTIVVDSAPDKSPLLVHAIKAGHFDLRLPEFFAWIGFCLFVNFARFFTGSTWQSGTLPNGLASVSPKSE